MHHRTRLRSTWSAAIDGRLARLASLIVRVHLLLIHLMMLLLLVLQIELILMLLSHHRLLLLSELRMTRSVTRK